MISRALSVVTVATLAFVINSAAALAEGTDPKDVGNNVKDIITPNAKAFWWVALVGGLLGMAFTRKASRAGGIAAMLLVSGIAIYNPAGVGSFMKNLADQIV